MAENLHTDSDRPLTRQYIMHGRAFAAYVWQRFQADRCLRVAASLSYTSLLAIVPLTAIAFAMLAAFPVFEGVRGEFQSAMFANLLPQSAEAMEDYFEQFIRNTSTLSAVGIVGLALTAILLLGTVEVAMNRIFRVSTPRALVPRLMMFWAVITLGPLLLGASFSLSTYFFAATEWVGVDTAGGPASELARFLPTLIIMVLLSLFYLIIPNRPVDFASAVAGGVLAGLLFSGLRKLFGIYVASFPTYQTIYGAVSVVPIFLVWMYLSWAVVLLGAVFTASVGEWRSAGGQPADRHDRAGPVLVIALQILAVLFEGSQAGGGIRRQQILKATSSGEEAVTRIFLMLRKTGLVERTAVGDWILARDLSSVTLFQLYQTLGLGFSEEDLKISGEGWRRTLSERLARAMEIQKSAGDITLRELLESETVPDSAKTVELHPVS